MNEMITAAAKKHPEMTVLDWNARARGKPDMAAAGRRPPHPDRRAEHGDDDQRGPRHARRRLPAAGARAPAVDRREDAAEGPAWDGAYATRLQARGGTVPYRWTRVSGALAPGLRLTTSGLVTGKPSQVGRYRFVARVVDRTGRRADGTFVLGVSR